MHAPSLHKGWPCLLAAGLTRSTAASQPALLDASQVPQPAAAVLCSEHRWPARCRRCRPGLHSQLTLNGLAACFRASWTCAAGTSWQPGALQPAASCTSSTRRPRPTRCVPGPQLGPENAAEPLRTPRRHAPAEQVAQLHPRCCFAGVCAAAAVCQGVPPCAQVWALARLGHWNHELMQKMASQCLGAAQLSRFNAQNLANVVRCSRPAAAQAQRSLAACTVHELLGQHGTCPCQGQG